MIRRTERYDSDPDTKDVPLSVEEAAWVRDNPKSVKTPADTAHLASRSLATAMAFRQARISFDEELRRRTAAQPVRGVPNTMNPETALKFLSPDQIAALFDQYSQQKLAAVESLRARAQAELQTLTTARAHAETALRAALNDAGTSPETRAAATAALNALTTPGAA